jgi:hypothetical protein
MDALTPAVILVARLLMMGPEGTSLLSEQRAGVPAGATGLLRETPGQPGLPGSLQIYMTPLPLPAPGAGDAGPAPLRVRLRSEIWSDPRGIGSGRPADEINMEDLTLQPGNAALVQLAEDAEGGRRLMLSLALAPPDATVPDLPARLSSPQEISMVVEAYRDRGGARELLERQVLRTLAGREVTWQTSWKRDVAPEGGGAVVHREEGLKLVVKPMAPEGGWISLEAVLEATVLPDSGDGEPRTIRSSVARSVTAGIPIELSLATSAADSPPAGKEAPRDSYLVVITPYVQAPSLSGP